MECVVSTTLFFSLTAAITSHICLLAKGSMPEREWRRGEGEQIIEREIKRKIKREKRTS